MGENKDKKFISERILGRNLTLGRALKFLVVSLLCGAVFGAAAFGVYYLIHRSTAASEQAQMESIAESLAESLAAEEAEQIRASEEAVLKEEEKNTEESLSISEMYAAESMPVSEDAPVPDSPESFGDAAEDTEGMEEGLPEETETSPLSEDQEDLVKKIIAEERENYAVQTEDLDRVLSVQQDACAMISRYIVRVSSYISETTWFESTVETERNYAGIILSKDEEEVLILTVDTAAQGADSLKVTFSDGTVRETSVLKTSERDGWTVLTVPAGSIPSDSREELEAVEIVPADEITAGMPVITAGAPMNAVNSFGFGYVNYVGEVISEVDGSSRSCYTGAQSVPEHGTFLMSQDGRLIGLGTEREEDSEAAGSRFLLAESCSVLLENLKKGNDQPWLGITGTDIPAETAGKKIPEGMYVTKVEENSPAFAAGLKRGDVITKIGSREIKGLSDYCSFLRNLRPGEVSTVTVMREALHSEYKELEMEMTAGTR